MPKPKLTDEQKRAKAVKYARWAVIAWPIGFVVYFGLLCLYFFKRYEPSSPFNEWDAVQMSIGLLLPAYGFADAKYTLRNKGKELGSPGYAAAILLFNAIPLIRDVQKHGIPRCWPLMLGASLFIMAFMTAWFVFTLRRVRSAQSNPNNSAG